MEVCPLGTHTREGLIGQLSNKSLLTISYLRGSGFEFKVA